MDSDEPADRQHQAPHVLSDIWRRLRPGLAMRARRPWSPNLRRGSAAKSWPDRRRLDAWEGYEPVAGPVIQPRIGLMGLTPSIFGYLQVPDGTQDTDICRMERDLRRFAKTAGFCLAAIFYEHESGSQAAFLELTHELRRADARNVVVPSLEHFSTHPLIRDLMLTHLEHGVGAQVWTVAQ